MHAIVGQSRHGPQPERRQPPRAHHWAVQGGAVVPRHAMQAIPPRRCGMPCTLTHSTERKRQHRRVDGPRAP